MDGCSVELFQSFTDVSCKIKHILIWISHHQALISGILALLAAVITLIITNNARKAKIRTRHTVLRSLSISKASEFMSTCESIVKYLDASYFNWKTKTTTLSSQFHISSDPYALHPQPLLSDEFTLKLAELIEGLNKKDMEFVTDLISRIQISEARVNELKSNLENPNTIVNETQFMTRIIDTLMLYTYAARILAYGRDPSLEQLPNFPNEISTTPIFNSNIRNNKNFAKLLRESIWPPKLIKDEQQEFERNQGG